MTLYNWDLFFSQVFLSAIIKTFYHYLFRIRFFTLVFDACSFRVFVVVMLFLNIVIFYRLFAQSLVKKFTLSVFAQDKYFILVFYGCLCRVFGIMNFQFSLVTTLSFIWP